MGETNEPAGAAGRGPASRDGTAHLRAATREHYERFPFIEGGPRRIALWQERMAAYLPDRVVADSLILDVGSSTGEVSIGLVARGARTVCLDLTEAALRRRHTTAPEAMSLCQGDALTLPFRDGSFDHSISIGVLHHTPDCWAGLAEMARVTRDGGRIVVLLYSRLTPYHAIYTLTSPLRKRPPTDTMDRLPAWTWALMRYPIAAGIHQVLDDTQLKHLLADQIWTPQATFHSAREVHQQAQRLGLRLLHWRRIPLYSNLFVFERR